MPMPDVRGTPGGRRDTDPPPFIPNLDQKNSSNAPGGSPEKNKDTIRFPTFSRKKSALDPNVVAEEKSFAKAKAKIEDDFTIIAELVTSSDRCDKYIIYNLCDTLSEIYERPHAAITISLLYNELLLHSHTFDPSYILTISAPAQYCQAHDNDSNAIIIAAVLGQALAVSPRRGIIKFIPTHLSCVAVGGRTHLGVFVEEIQADREARAVVEQQTRGRRRTRSVSSLRVSLSRRERRNAEGDWDRSAHGDSGAVVDDENKEEESGEGEDDGDGSAKPDKGKGRSTSFRSVFYRWRDSL
ncbi:hypothetical protein VE02_04961 [Pseudogymnoascus sp. 03VT05]|nr:hypothetical protein VE02_04961 [Pseudogymnoascus sp. 03VT05]